MKEFLDQHPSVKNYLGILNEQTQASDGATRTETSRAASFIQKWSQHTSRSIVYVNDSTQARTSAAISSELPSGVNIHHRLDLDNWRMWTWIYGQFGGLLRDGNESIVKGTSDITVQVPRIPLVLQKHLWIVPIWIIQKLWLLKMDSIFWEGALIVWIDTNTVTIMSGKRVIKYRFPWMQMISSSSIDSWIHSELAAEVAGKMKDLRTGLMRVSNTFALPRKKGGDNRSFDLDLIS